MQEINLDLKMCGQFMKESCTKIAPVQNQNYFMDKIFNAHSLWKKWVLLNFLLRVRNVFVLVFAGVAPLNLIFCHEIQICSLS